MNNILFTIVFIIIQLHTNNANLLKQVGRLYLENVGTDATESIAVYTDNSVIFSANGDTQTIDVISFKATKKNIDAGNIPMKLIKKIDVIQPIMDSYGVEIEQITSVSMSEKKKLVYAVAAPVEVAKEIGYLLVIDASSTKIKKIVPLTDCYCPDHVTQTNNERIIVSCEGEADDNEEPIPDLNPPGSVTIVDAKSYKVWNVKFDKFNEGGSKTLPEGIYQPYASEPFDINAEPEYSVVDCDDKYAYVTLQENNGVAVLDIKKKEIISIFALGVTDYGKNGLDASNKDDKINIQTYSNLYGLRMPDGIDFVKRNGKEYIITANEGDSKDFDESRVKDIILDPNAFPNWQELQQDENLGRLKIINSSINQWGKNTAGLFEKLYAFNSRDFTIYEIVKTNGKPKDIRLAYSSLDDFEQITATQLGTKGFNANAYNPSFDSRSDDKGSEPDAIVVGKCKCDNSDKEKLYSFVALERVGGIMVYDITDINKPEFVEYVNNRNFDEVTDARRPSKEAGDTMPEHMQFIDASVYGEALLFVSYTFSSSIGIFTFDCDSVIGVCDEKKKKKKTFKFKFKFKFG